jgi:hypothetical protein
VIDAAGKQRERLHSGLDAMTPEPSSRVSVSARHLDLIEMTHRRLEAARD